jgi:hypothetical protein
VLGEESLPGVTMVRRADLTALQIVTAGDQLGLPNMSPGDAIPLGARTLRVVDVRSARPPKG